MGGSAADIKLMGGKLQAFFEYQPCNGSLLEDVCWGFVICLLELGRGISFIIEMKQGNHLKDEA